VIFVDMNGVHRRRDMRFAAPLMRLVGEALRQGVVALRASQRFGLGKKGIALFAQRSAFYDRQIGEKALLVGRLAGVVGKLLFDRDFCQSRTV
jgi:hypothetical protein